MLDFMVLGAPRSGTTWAANWLTTDASLCIHDPLCRFKLEDLDGIVEPRILGVSCTALCTYTEWANKHPARKIIIHRPIEEVDKSLCANGLPQLGEGFAKLLTQISGLHVYWRSLFDPLPAAAIYEFLLDRPFDAVRHRELVQMNVQPNFASVEVNDDAMNVLSRHALAMKARDWS